MGNKVGKKCPPGKKKSVSEGSPAADTSEAPAESPSSGRSPSRPEDFAPPAGEEESYAPRGRGRSFYLEGTSGDAEGDDTAGPPLPTGAGGGSAGGGAAGDDEEEPYVPRGRGRSFYNEAPDASAENSGSGAGSVDGGAKGGEPVKELSFAEQMAMKTQHAMATQLQKVARAKAATAKKERLSNWQMFNEFDQKEEAEMLQVGGALLAGPLAVHTVRVPVRVPVRWCSMHVLGCSVRNLHA